MNVQVAWVFQVVRAGQVAADLQVALNLQVVRAVTGRGDGIAVLEALTKIRCGVTLDACCMLRRIRSVFERTCFDSLA